MSAAEFIKVPRNLALVLKDRLASRHHKICKLAPSRSYLVTYNLRVKIPVVTIILSEPPPTSLSLRLCLPFRLEKPNPLRVYTPA
jgi:hypothetical protein